MNKSSYNLLLATLILLDCICGSTTAELGLLGLYINDRNVALSTRRLKRSPNTTYGHLDINTALLLTNFNPLWLQRTDLVLELKKNAVVSWWTCPVGRTAKRPSVTKMTAAPMNLLETGDAKTSTTPIKKRQQPVNHTSQIEIVRRHNVDHQQQQQLQYTCEQMETFGYGQRNEDDFATGIGSNRRSPPPTQELHDGKAQERRQPSNVVTSRVVVFANSPGRRRTQCGDGNSLPNQSTTTNYVDDCLSIVSVCHRPHQQPKWWPSFAVC